MLKLKNLRVFLRDTSTPELKTMQSMGLLEISLIIFYDMKEDHGRKMSVFGDVTPFYSQP